MEKASSLESNLLKAFRDYLDLTKTFYQRVHVSGVPHSARGRIFYSKNEDMKGASDIYVIVKGKFGAIELKAKGKKASPDQITYLRNVLDNGGHALVTDDLGEAIQFVEDLKHGIRHEQASCRAHPDTACHEIYARLGAQHIQASKGGTKRITVLKGYAGS